MTLNLSAATAILRDDYHPMIRAVLNGDQETIRRLQAENVRRRIEMYGYGPHLYQIMPLELHPENVWYWLPEDVEEDCCDCCCC